MTILIAYVNAKADELASAFISYGYSWKNPITGEISLFSVDGDRVVVPTPEAAIREHEQGALLQLWQTGTLDLPIGGAPCGACLFFDGWRAKDVAGCLSILESQKISYRVCTDDS